MERTYCDNCNQESSLNRVRIVTGPDDEYVLSSANSYWTRWVCERCLGCLNHLDFSEFARRHDMRPRKADLP